MCPENPDGTRVIVYALPVEVKIFEPSSILFLSKMKNYEQIKNCEII